MSWMNERVIIIMDYGYSIIKEVSSIRSIWRRFKYAEVMIYVFRTNVIYALITRYLDDLDDAILK